MTPGVRGSFLGRNGNFGGPVIYNVSLRRLNHGPFVLARALDAESGDAFTGRTSERRGNETYPQQSKVVVQLIIGEHSLSLERG